MPDRKEKKIFTYQELDIPPIPSCLLEDWDYTQGNLETDNYERNLQYKMTRNGIQVIPARNLRWTITGQLLHWINQHVTKKYDMCGYAITTGSADHLPHCDNSGDYKLLYVVDPGGDNVITSFYETSDDVPCGWRPSNYDSLIEIDRFKAKINSWIIINTRIIHGVSNITGERHLVSLTCFGNPEEFCVANELR